MRFALSIRTFQKKGASRLSHTHTPLLSPRRDAYFFLETCVSPRRDALFKPSPKNTSFASCIQRVCSSETICVRIARYCRTFQFRFELEKCRTARSICRSFLETPGFTMRFGGVRTYEPPEDHTLTYRTYIYNIMYMFRALHSEAAF